MIVVFSPAAEQDLGSLFKYIDNDLQNPIAARNITEKLLRISYKLTHFPELGVSLGFVDPRLNAYRRLLVDNYLVIYKVADQDVVILRILYARSDYLQLLGE